MFIKMELHVYVYNNYIHIEYLHTVHPIYNHILIEKTCVVYKLNQISSKLIQQPEMQSDSAVVSLPKIPPMVMLW